MTNAIAEQDGMGGAGTSAETASADRSKRDRQEDVPEMVERVARALYDRCPMTDQNTDLDGRAVGPVFTVPWDSDALHEIDRDQWRADARAAIEASSAPKLLEALRPFAELYDGDASDLKDGVDGVVMAPMHQSEIRAAFLAVSSALGA